MNRRLIVSHKELAKSLSRVQGLAERRNLLPIQGQVKFTCEGDKITLTTQDSEMSISDSFFTAQAASLQFTVPAQLTYDIVRKLFNCSEISFTLADEGASNKTATVKAGASAFNLPYMEADAFLGFAEPLPSCAFSIPLNQLQYLFSKTRHAMSAEENQYQLRGIYLHFVENNILRAVATDTHRLAKAEVILSDGVSSIQGVIIPRKIVFELLKLMEELKKDSVVSVVMDQKRIKFSVDNTILISKLVDSAFPNYESAFKRSVGRLITMNRIEASRAIDLVTTLIDDKIKLVRLAVNSDKITISAVARTASGEQTMPASGDIDEEIVLLLNAKYILDVLTIIDSHNVGIIVNDGLSPVMITDTTNSSVGYLLMPMQLST